MNKCENFLNYFDWLVANCKEPVVIPDEVKEFYDILRSQQDKHIDKPLFTETGLQILEYLKTQDARSLKAKDIADGMEISSRKVSGSIRKLVTDGFVEKYGANPVVYTLTEKGKNFDIQSYKGELNNEQETD